jgi:hypothetical protein
VGVSKVSDQIGRFCFWYCDFILSCVQMVDEVLPLSILTSYTDGVESPCNLEQMQTKLHLIVNNLFE